MTLITRGVPRTVAAALTIALSMGGMLGAQASAKPPAKPGAPADIAVTVTKPGSSYSLASTWSSVASATSYKVGVTSVSGASLGGGTVSQPAWTGSVAAAAGSSVHLTVTAFNGTRKGGSTTVTEAMPDLTAPTGSYSATWPATTTGPTVTVTLANDGVSDDVSSPAAIKVSVDWGDGSAPTQTDGSAPTITHDYALTQTPTRYVPVITLTDAAGNTSTAPVDAVVIADTTPPVATATLGQSTAWAAYSKVSLTQSATDNLSPEADITRSVNWGDGTVQTVKGDSVLSHVYRTAGSYPVQVTDSDEAQPANSVVVQAGTIAVKADTVRPTVLVQAPAKLRTYVSSWRVVKGTAADVGTGVRAVPVRIVERRLNGSYYGYNAVTRRWLLGKTLGAAFKQSTPYLAAPSAGQWQESVNGLQQGRLYIHAWSIDNVGNLSAMRSPQQVLSHR